MIQAVEVEAAGGLCSEISNLKFEMPSSGSRSILDQDTTLAGPPAAPAH